MGLVLRDYQVQCIKNIQEAMSQGIKKIAITLPTGGGKTAIFIKLAKQYVDETKNQVVVLSHLSVLTTQTYNRFKEDEPSLKIGILQADRYPDSDCDVVISTMQSSRIEDKIVMFEYFKTRRVGMVIADECHMVGTPGWDAAIANFGDHFLIGVTATPFRDGHIMTNYFDTVAYTIAPQDLIDRGYLVPPEMYQIEMESHALSEERMARVAHIYKEKEYLRKSVVFMKTIEDAKAMRNIFVDNGINSYAITSELVGKERDELLERFRTGDIHVLTTVNVLTAGFDAPCIESIFMPYHTQSPTTYMQRIGRGLRIFPNKKSCRIYCFGDAPSIKKGLYKKLHDVAFNGGSKRDTIHDDIALYELFGETNTQEYLWCTRMVQVSNMMDSLGLKSISRLITHKQLPKRFMERLDILVKNINKTPYNPESGSPTYRQKLSLQNLGWTLDQIGEITAGEASNIIAALNKTRMQALNGETDIIPTGKYAGQRVKDTPYYYRKVILDKYPNSFIAKIIKRHGG